MGLMKRRKHPGLMEALKAAAADIPLEMCGMSEEQVAEMVKEERREIRKEKEEKSRGSAHPQAPQGRR